MTNIPRSLREVRSVGVIDIRKVRESSTRGSAQRFGQSSRVDGNNAKVTRDRVRIYLCDVAENEEENGAARTEIDDISSKFLFLA